jgi:hypothetical protein
MDESTRERVGSQRVGITQCSYTPTNVTNKFESNFGKEDIQLKWHLVVALLQLRWRKIHSPFAVPLVISGSRMYYGTRLPWAGEVLPCGNTIFSRLHNSGSTTLGQGRERQSLPADKDTFILEVEKNQLLGTYRASIRGRTIVCSRPAERYCARLLVQWVRLIHATSELLTTGNMSNKYAVFRDVALCIVTEIYWGFGETCCSDFGLLYSGDGGTLFLYTVGKLLPECMAPHLRRQ